MNTANILILLLACSAILGGAMIVIYAHHKWREHIDETKYWEEMGELYANFLNRCKEIERQMQKKLAARERERKRKANDSCRQLDNL